jgi:plasmid stabilization system protein ParE
MPTTDIRQKLHHFIDSIEDKRIKAIYTLFENEIEQEGFEYTDAFKAELDKRYAYYKNGGKMVSAADKRGPQIRPQKMIYKYIYDPVALSEYRDAVLWYDDRSGVVAERFILAIKERIKDICTNPLRYRNTYTHFRETSLKKYPYSIVYFVDEPLKTVVITSVYHHKRDPRRKYKK